MKRVIFSAFSVLLAAGAIAPTAHALPQIDPAFKLQTLRLNELDARNKSEETPQHYPETYQPSSQNEAAEQGNIPTTESTVWETSETQEEDTASALSLTERRHQSLDRS